MKKIKYLFLALFIACLCIPSSPCNFVQVAHAETTLPKPGVAPTTLPSSTKAPSSTPAPPATVAPPTKNDATKNDASKKGDSTWKERLNKLMMDGDTGQKLCANAIYNCYFKNNVTDLVSSVFSSISDMNVFKSSSALKTIYNAIAIFGYALVSLYFILELIEKASTSQVTLEQFGSCCIKAVLAKVVIDKGWDIMTYLFSAAMKMANSISTGAFLSDNMDASLYAALADEIKAVEDGNFFGNVFKSLTYWGNGVIPFVCGFLAIIIMWSTLIEIVVKSLFAPIAFAEIANTGINGPGMRYLKKLLVTYLQFASILLSLWMCQYIRAQFLAVSTMNILMASLAFQLITVSMMMKSASFVQDAVRP